MHAELTLRRVAPADRAAVLEVEALSTPGLRYLPDVFDMFVAEPRGEFFLAERAGAVLACAKFTVVADGSAWLETLRVVPSAQRQGIGRRLYERYMELARAERTPAMRLYTGLSNAASRGLAEQFGFALEETFVGMAQAPGPAPSAPDMAPVRDAGAAAALLLPHAEAWGGFVVLNRTFYRLSEALCAELAARGLVYAGPAGALVLGARFSPRAALHIGMYAGDAPALLAFAQRRAAEAGVGQLSCLLPQRAERQQRELAAIGMQPHPAPYIVLRADAAG